MWSTNREALWHMDRPSKRAPSVLDKCCNVDSAIMILEQASQRLSCEDQRMLERTSKLKSGVSKASGRRRGFSGVLRVSFSATSTRGVELCARVHMWSSSQQCSGARWLSVHDARSLHMCSGAQRGRHTSLDSMTRCAFESC